MADPLSVRNESCQILEGPQTLHGLIKWDREEDPALDFLNANDERKTYTFGELRRCISSLVTDLRQHRDFMGSEEKHVIPILLPQSPALYIAMLAILEVGAAFCPINLDSPAERIKFVIRDVSASIIITTRDHESRIQRDDNVKVILVDEAPIDTQANMTVTPSCSRILPQELAYVMYTSGSSGTPKGVGVSHLAASQSILAHERHIPVFQRFLQFAAPSFDVSIFEIFFPLIRGSTLVGRSRSQMLNDLTGTINKLDIDAAELTPTVVGSLIQQRSNVPRLRLLLTIGEMLTRPVIDAFGQSETSAGILYGMYGPTEAAIHCTINPRMHVGSNVRNIGIPFDTTSIFIIAIDESNGADASSKILPAGEIGELVLGGSQLATGYLNRPDQNRSAFITIKGQRAYRTGDRARLMSDGTIEIHGRISAGQVKLRGQRVELGEIEEAVYKHPDIKTASARVLNGALVVFALEKSPGTSTDEILRTCAEWLPKFMVPSEIMILEAFPYLPSGKINLRQLEADYQSRRLQIEDHELQDFTPAEALVNKGLQKILGRQVRPSDRLATYGLDSLLAIRVASELRSSGIPISTVEVLGSETLSVLAKFCETAKKMPPTPELMNDSYSRGLFDAARQVMDGDYDVEKISDILPCTPLQDAMLSETARDTLAYNNEIELELSSEFDEDSARSAFCALAQHNPILQTGFIELHNSKSVYVQVIWKSMFSSQFSVVSKFSHPISTQKGYSMLHPLHVQIKRFGDRVRMVLHIHHALYDAWSLELLLDDLDAILRNGDVSARPSFRNVVEVALMRNQSDESWSSKDYWRDHLMQLDPRTLPNFQSVVDVLPGLDVTRKKTAISTAKLDSVARDRGVSSQSFFQAAYALVLSSYVGMKDICFGTVFSGRTAGIQGIEDIAGPCLSTLPIRVDLTTMTSSSALIERVALTTRKHLNHDTLPLWEIKKLCGIDPGRLLFDSILVWQQTLHDPHHHRESVALVGSVDYLEFNLTLEISPGIEDIELKANYQRALFPESQINILLGQIEQLVMRLMHSPTTALDQMCAFLKQELLSIQNPSPQLCQPTLSLSASVESLAVKYPDAPAIDFAHCIDAETGEIQHVTYSELNARANQLARHLTSCGVKSGHVICICMEKSPELYIAILASIKSGAGYLPVAPDTPAERLQSIISEAKIQLILSHSSMKQIWRRKSAANILCSDELDISSLPSHDLLIQSDSESLAYCIFTSGSTGTPKGVQITKGNLMSNMENLSQLYPHSGATRLLQSCSQAFDVSVFDIFFTWHNGGCLCSAGKDVLFRDIEMAIRVLEITHLSLTPTVAALVDPQKTPDVEFLVTAGEPLTQKVFNAWAGRGLYNAYGPSETTNIVTVRPNVSKEHFISNIGWPLKNTSTFVIDPAGSFDLVPRGGEGELCFGGAQIGSGYSNPSQAAEKFFDHPKYGRLYRTGDLGRLMPDDSLNFSRRQDDQVKIRGQRVELGEINSNILESSEVVDCASLVIEDTDHENQRLVTFWVPKCFTSRDFTNLTPDPSIMSALFSSLASALPAYMIPSALIPISKLPLTAQGKIDNRFLVKNYKSLGLDYLNQSQKTLRSSSNHAWTDMEKKIAEGVAQIAKVPWDNIGPETSFFSLGIDSISAISLSRLLKEKYKLQVDISGILRHASVVRLAELIKSKTTPDPSVHLLEHATFGFETQFLTSTTADLAEHGLEIDHIFPCTPLQEAMLSASEGTLKNAYCNHTVLALHISIDRFQNAWSEMAKRHEILRTCFVKTNMTQSVFAQVVVRDFFRVPELVQVSEESAADVLQDLCSYDISITQYKPPYKLDFVKSTRSTKLVISMHHALYDGMALSILFDEIESTLRSMPLPPSVSFGPFLRNLARQPMTEADQYWERLLDGFYPIAFPRPFNNVDPATTCSSISSPATSKLSWIEERIKTHSTSLLSVCQTVWAALLAERLESSDVCFGNIVSGRTVSVDGIDRLVAPCFNSLPIRVIDIHKLSYLELFRVMQTQDTECLPFQLSPLRRIQSQCRTDETRLFDTLLILQPPRRELDSNIWTVENDIGAMDMPVVIEAVPNPTKNTLDLTLQFHTNYLSKADAAELLKAFDRTLIKSLENPRYQALVMNLSMFSKSRHQRQQEQQVTLNNEVEENAAGDNTEMISTELQIRHAFANFTDVPADRIGTRTNIYRIGIDSISAVQIAAALRRSGHQIVASDILEHVNVERLAKYLVAKATQRNVKRVEFDFDSFDKKHRLSICSRLNISPQYVDSVRPCTPVQCGMLAQSLHSDGKEYINSICMNLLPTTSVKKLRAAWKSTMDQHEMLRTGFVEMDTSNYQFAMITYAKEQVFLPWSEMSDCKHELSSVSQHMVVQQLSSLPWRLQITRTDGITQLYFTAHHALYDARSLELILSDVTRAYALVERIEHPQINPMLGAILQAGEDNTEDRQNFWEKQNSITFNKFPSLTPLHETSEKSFVTERTSKFSMSQLEKSCKRHDVSIQGLGQAAWARLLSAYIGETSVTFGVTFSGRSVIEDADSVPFPSIVTLPVTCRVTGVNQALLSKMMHLNAKIHKHQFTPLSDIKKWSEDRGGKMFDTLFAYQKTELSDTLPESVWTIANVEASVDCALSIELLPSENGHLGLRLTARDNVVPNEQAKLLLEQFDALLEDTLQNPQNPCDTLNSHDPALVSVTPAVESALQSDVQLLHQFVEIQSSALPEKIALEFASAVDSNRVRSDKWTYKQLNFQANGISNVLLNTGVNQGDLIAICFEKCPAASFAILGILKAGCAYVALDPNAPTDRLKFIIEDSNTRLVLTTGKPAEVLRAASLSRDVTIVDIGHDGGTHSVDFEPPQLSKPVNPEETCYCLYTSGTTGTPKGCEISHENAVQAMLSFRRLFASRWSTSSKWLQFASFHFDVSVLEQFWSWSVGICVVSAPRDLIFEDLPGRIKQLGITHIDLTPSLARLVQPDDAPGLCDGVFITGGEQLRQDVLDVWGPKGCIYNGYGPTEATIGCTMYPRVPANGKPSNIGCQFDNVGSFVLKPGTSQPVMRGAVGELCVSGKLVGKGYLNRPDLTRERFPHLRELGERVYRTGDLVRILHDGTFLFLGRADDQVKLRGQRLELSEINEVMKRDIQELQDVVTLVLKHNEQQSEQLVTFFVAKTSNRGLTGLMREVCSKRLPGYMIPTNYISLDALPLSANNKVDSRQLAKFYNKLSFEDLQDISASGQSRGAWSTEEQKFVEVLAKAVHVEPGAIKRSTNIFELGVDSISVIGISRTLQNAGYEKAKLPVIMKHSSIGSLIEVLIAGTGSTTPINQSQIVVAQELAAFAHKHKAFTSRELGVEWNMIEVIAPCTPAQEGMIYRFLESDKAPYFNHFGFVLAENVDEEVLSRAWSKVVDQLQVLRTKFVLTTEGCAQAVLKKVERPWNSLEVETDIDIEMYNAVRTQQHEETLRESSKALELPWKVTIGRNGTKRVLALQIFHGLYDGISLPMLLRKIQEEYYGIPHDGYGPDFHSVLPYGPLSTAMGTEDFWRKTLRNIIHQSLPKITECSSQKDVLVSRNLGNIGHLENLRQRLGVTYQAALLAAWVSVIQKYLTSNLSIGLVISGRSIDFEGAEKVSGPLLNTVVFHIEIRPGMTWKSLIQSCHDYNVTMIPYQHTPLKDVQKWCGAGANQPLFDTLFVFQREEEENYAGEPLWRVLPTPPIADYPLSFEAELRRNGDIQLTIVGQGSFIDESVGTGLLEKVEDALRSMEHPDSSIPTNTTAPNGHVNGVHDLTTHESIHASTSQKDFIWTRHAMIIREEIKSLSGVADVKENISIFELGLDSIDVIKLSSRLKKQGVHIPVSSIIKSQNVANMITQIVVQTQVNDDATSPLTHHEQNLMRHLQQSRTLPDDALTALPATPLQEAMVAEMIASGYTRYFNHDLFRIADHVEIERLKRAWNTVVSSNDILRTSFVEIDDVELPMTFAQIIHSPRASIWQTVQVSNTVPLESASKKLIEEATQKASGGQLMQMVELRHRQGTYFLLSIAHALYDGWSLQGLHNDVRSIYNGRTPDRPSPRKILDGIFSQDSPDAEDFWRTSLAELPSSIFPKAPSREHANPLTVHRWERRSIHPFSKVQSFCRLTATTPQVIGQTVWSLVLAKHLQRLDVAFGAVLSCRDTEEANEVMFPLMNTVPVRAVLHGTRRAMLRYMQDNANAIRQYQHFPLRKAQCLAGLNGQEEGLFDTLFIYQGQRKSQTTEELYESVESISEVEFTVCVEVEIVDNTLVWRTACKDSCRTTTGTDELLDELEEVLGRIMSDIDHPTMITDPNGISICGLKPFHFEPVISHSDGDALQTKSSLQTGIWTELELMIRKVLSQVTKLPEADIGKDQTIFHLGLDSISAIKLSSILRREGIKLGVSNILKNNTVASLAEFIGAEGDKTRQTSFDTDKVLSSIMKNVDCQVLLREVGLNGDDFETIMPVTPGQLYVLARWQASEGSLFCAQFNYLVGSADEERLNNAWKSLQVRHPILRTRFVIGDRADSLAFQIVSKKPQTMVNQQDVLLPEKSATSLLTPVLLSVETEGKEKILRLQILHALYDGSSLPLLLQDLADLYNHPSKTIPAPNFRDFVARGFGMQPWADQRRRRFWQSYLHKETLALTNPSTVSQVPNGRIEVFQPSVRIGNIATIARSAGVSVDALILAAYSKVYTTVLLKHFEDITFGLYLSNRSTHESMELRAPTLNFLPIRIDTSHTILEAAQRVQRDLQAISDEDVVNSSLLDIWQWTGVRIDCFVNILKPWIQAEPEDEDHRSSQSLFAGTGQETIMRRPRSEIIDTVPSVKEGQASEYQRKLNEIYLPSIDVELRLLRDGNLDIGVFAPVNMLDVSDANKLIIELGKELMACESR
ncbi:MAG: hypothetical protein M1818_004300 [Claussenomyces sp. TS43310]|nr:MAG: hypothetical protein M1818_004300 [Claussenomyces sp. TS43310]